MQERQRKFKKPNKHKERTRIKKKHYITETKTNQSAKTQKEIQKAMENIQRKHTKDEKQKNELISHSIVNITVFQ